MVVKTFRDLMAGHDRVQIQCLYSQKLVRRLRLIDPDSVEIDPIIGDLVTVAADTPIEYQPWVFDRGNMLFSADATHPRPDVPAGQMLKICGEGDLVIFDGGETERILPEFPPA